MVHSHTVHLPRGALLSPCTVCGTGLGVLVGLLTLRLVRPPDNFRLGTVAACTFGNTTGVPVVLRPHMVHCHTVHLPLGALLIACTMCGTGRAPSRAAIARTSHSARPGS